MMSLWSINTLCKWLKEPGEWFWGGAFIIVVAVTIAWNIDREKGYVIIGGLLQLLGILVTIFAIFKNLERFGYENPFIWLFRWIRGIPSDKGHKTRVSAHMKSLYSQELEKINPEDNIETEIDKLNNNLQFLNEKIDFLYNQLILKITEDQRRTESQVREVHTDQKKIKDHLVGSYAVPMTGAVFIWFGILLTTLAPLLGRS